ncbi:MAG: hypothetical protein V3R98_09240 [Alphaproteobacteria bacterium]
MQLKVLRVLLPILVVPWLSACASAAAERAALAQQALVGMPRSQLLSCAGVPERSREDPEGEYFTYENLRIFSTPTASVGVYGGGRYGYAFRAPLATQVESSRCEATFTLIDGRVTQLVYTSVAGGGRSRYAECAAIVDACLTAIAPSQP